MRISSKKVSFSFSVLFLVCFICVQAGEYQYPFDQYDRDPLAHLVGPGGRLLIAKDAAVSDFVLQGVIYAVGASRAVISGEILKRGDSIRGYTVMMIDKKKVILEKAGEQFTLKLEE